MKRKTLFCFLICLIIVIYVSQFVQAENDYQTLSKDFGFFQIQLFDGTTQGDRIIYKQGYILLPFKNYDTFLSEEYIDDFIDEDEYFDDFIDEDEPELLDESDLESSILVAQIPITAMEYDPATDQLNLQSIQPIEFALLMNAYASITDAKLNEEGLHLYGSITIESDAFPCLDGQGLQITNFLLPYEGQMIIDAKVKSTKPLVLYDAVQLNCETCHFRYDDFFHSFYFKDGTMQFTECMTQLITAEPAQIKIIEIEETDEVVKFDTDLYKQNTLLRGMESHIFINDLYSGQISLSGNICLPEVMPGDFSKLPLCIYNLNIDLSSGQILNFSAYPQKNLPILINDWAFEIYGVNFADEEIKFTAAFRIPYGLLTEIYHGLSGQHFNMNSLTFNWDGTIKELNVIIPLPVKFALQNGIIVTANEIGTTVENGTMDSNLLWFAQPLLYLPPKGEEVIHAEGLGVDAQGNLIWPDYLTQYKSEFTESLR